MGYLIDALGGGVFAILAPGGFVAAAAVWLAIRFGRVPGWLGEVAIAACVGLALFSYGWRAADKSNELRRLREVVAIQAAQREAAEALAQRELQRSISRLRENETLQQKVEGYESLLASGAAQSCPADDAYTRSMRNITIGKPAAP